MPEPPASLGLSRRTLRIVLVLFGIAFVHRLVLAIWTTTVASDGTYSLWAAEFCARGDWQRTLASFHGIHPLYSILIAAFGAPGGHFVGAAYGVSILFSAAVTVPLFFLVRGAWNERLATWTGVLYGLHPIMALEMTETINTGLFVGLFMAALGLFVSALRGGNFLFYPLSGLAASLCYLTRPEGLYLVPLFIAVSIHAAFQIRRKAAAAPGPELPAPTRRAGMARIAGGVALSALALVLAAAPYVIWLHRHTGRWTLTNRPSAAFLLDKILRRSPPPTPPVIESRAEEPPAPPPSIDPAPATPAAPRLKAGSRPLPVVAVKMFSRTFYWPLIPLFVLGLASCGRQGGRWSALLPLLAISFATLLPPLLLFFATGGRYALSPRYFLIPVLFLLPWCAAGAAQIFDAAARLLERTGKGRFVPALGLGLLLCLSAVLLGKSVGPRRPEEISFLDAATWVRSQSEGRSTRILAVRQKLAYYAGGEFVPLPVWTWPEAAPVYADRVSRAASGKGTVFLMLTAGDARRVPEGFIEGLARKGFREAARFPKDDLPAVETVRVYRRP